MATKLIIALAGWSVFMIVAAQSLGGETDRIEQAKQITDLILRLCIANGSENVEIRREGNSVEVGTKGAYQRLDTRESSGLIGGISKEITELSAQQASEARACTQKYLQKVLDFILEPKSPPRPALSAPGPTVSAPSGSVACSLWSYDYDGNRVCCKSWTYNYHGDRVCTEWKSK